MSPRPLQIKLPVCPKCHNIGAGSSTGKKGTKFSCVGPTKAPHKKTSMEPRLFREVIPESEEST